jgi:hypothetical protein
MSNTIIDNVVFAYVKIQSPVNKYQSTDSEFTVDCVVSKAQAKEWNKAFPKQKAKVVENDEFTDKFKMDLPFPDQDEQYVLKLKKPHIKNGKELDQRYRPRVFLSTDGEPKDITFDTLPANGSKGKAAYTVRSNDFGTFSQLDSILIEDLIEYKSGAVVGGAFGVTSVAEAPAAKVVNKQTDAAGSSTSDDALTVTSTQGSGKKAATKASQSVVDDVESEDLDEAPF